MRGSRHGSRTPSSVSYCRSCCGCSGRGRVSGCGARWWSKRGRRVRLFTGLATQWHAPMPAEMAAAATVYGGIGFFITCQLIALVLLFRRCVVDHFNTNG